MFKKNEKKYLTFIFLIGFCSHNVELYMLTYAEDMWFYTLFLIYRAVINHVIVLTILCVIYQILRSLLPKLLSRMLNKYIIITILLFFVFHISTIAYAYVHRTRFSGAMTLTDFECFSSLTSLYVLIFQLVWVIVSYPHKFLPSKWLDDK